MSKLPREKFSGTVRKISKEEAQKILEQIGSKSKSIKSSSVKVIESVEDKDKRLMRLYHKMKMQKLADAYKSDGRLDHIKSVGNGL